MPKPLGSLFSLKAKGKIGGHRRRRAVPLEEEVEVPFAHPIVEGYVPGDLTLGLKLPLQPYSGDPWTTSKVYGVLSGPPIFSYVAVGIEREGVNLGYLIFPALTPTASFNLILDIADGQWFRANVLVIGDPPPVGNDLVWQIVGKP